MSVFLGLVNLALVLWVLRLDRIAPWVRFTYVLVTVWAAMSVSAALVQVAHHDMPAATLSAVVAGINAYRLWRHRRPRQRRPSWVAGRVRDLGHRLVVAEAPR